MVYGKKLFSLQNQEWKAFAGSFALISHLLPFKALIYNNISVIHQVVYGI